MTSSPDPGVIKINLNIEIPLNGNTPQVSVLNLKPLSDRTPSIIFPRGYPGGGLTHVCNLGICVAGVALDGGMPASQVYVKLYPAPYSNDPDDPTLAGVDSQQRPQADGHYLFNVLCNPNTLGVAVVWAKWSDSSYTHTVVTFKTGSSGLYTDCNYPYPFFQNDQPALAKSLELMPAVWQLIANGFHGSNVSAFNGNWQLRHVGGESKNLLYCNRGDGIKFPRIELRCRIPGADSWELWFSSNGNRICYQLPINTFDSQKCNVFQTVLTAELNEEASVPAKICISPL